ncbi:MAG: hypothetical protein LBK25_01320 [Treponema sp.]|nr:hypothetical protein [Treponema sp.]
MTDTTPGGGVRRCLTPQAQGGVSGRCLTPNKKEQIIKQIAKRKDGRRVGTGRRAEAMVSEVQVLGGGGRPPLLNPPRGGGLETGGRTARASVCQSRLGKDAPPSY